MRARLAAVRNLRQARQQLSGFLLRHGRHYNRPAWTLMHRRWMAGLRFEQAAHHIVLEDCIAAVEAATARRDRLEAHIEAALGLVAGSVVRALQALRGMAMVAAATVIAELGDITARNPQLMAYLGLVPRALQRRARRKAASRKPGMAQPANADRSGLELSVSGAHQPGATAAQEGLAKPIRDTAWKARSGCAGAIASSPGGKITHCGHDGDCSRTGGICLGDRKHVQIAGA